MFRVIFDACLLICDQEDLSERSWIERWKWRDNELHSYLRDKRGSDLFPGSRGWGNQDDLIAQ